MPSALKSADLVSQLKDVQLETMSVVYAPDQGLAAQARDKLKEKKAHLLTAIDAQLKNAGSDAQRGLVEQVKEGVDNYFGAIDESVKQKLDDKQEIAQALFFGNVVQYQNELEQIVGTLRVEKDRSKDNAITALNDNMSGTKTALTVVTVLATIILGGLGALLYRQIANPISNMQQMMSEIATSQDFARRVPVGRMDEIGHSIVAFNGMIEKIQESSTQLKQKTADIQSMLQNIPQGILMIVHGNQIHPEYSAFLETLFETKQIAGKNLMELVFSNTYLGADVLSQVEAVSGACIGEDAMNFEFNQHLMVGEVEKKMPDGRSKILDLSWSPIIDETNTVARLMLCVRDVTELRKLAAEANEQKRELEMIGEILAVSQEKFHEFIVGSLKLIDENELLIRQHSEASPSALTKLFRNMHTVKGNGRTYGLHYLTNIVHEAEQSYDELRKPHSNIAWDQQMLMAELSGVRSAIERYARINEVSLGRKGPGRRGNAERYLMVDKKHIQETLSRLENVNTSNLHELIAVRNSVRKTLRQLGTERIGETLASIIDSTPSLAAELGKEAPSIVIEENGYVVHNQANGVLKNVFMHLFRNAIDHGIEMPDVRQEKGKPAAGIITLKVDSENGMLRFRLHDDGRGLALGNIRKAAIDKGILGERTQVTDEETARFIFLTGFSTAEKVTAVSGRGVGMDAVQDFVRREGGKIEICFTDNQVGADFRQFMVVVYLPESFAANLGAGDQVFTDETVRSMPETGGTQKLSDEKPKTGDDGNYRAA
ncbi:MAG: Chemotaxis related protein [Burkholderiaceae bacterium]|nr:Chemotaxis related protein [Burkholderiaceae bacterium]